MNRNTVQRAIVLDTVKKLQCHATADEIYAEIHKDFPTISRATVYRDLQKLCELGEIRKREIPGSADRYDHSVSNHYHVRCVKCGRVSDVDMDYLPDLEKSIKNIQGFIFLNHDIVFNGLCAVCAETENRLKEI